MTCKRNLLFLLAHQDDEVFVAPRILYERRRGADIRVIYLTTGAPNLRQTQIRNEESRVALQQLSVGKEHIFFLGSEFNIPDGRLVNKLEKCFATLINAVEGESYDEIYAPAWEGGHQDHDASFLIGLALAQRLGIEANFWQFYLYNGHNTRGRFFRVFHPLSTGLERRERALDLAEALTVARSILAFKSQKKTWFGLAPQTLFHFLFVRTEVFQRGGPSQLLTPPHSLPLLYERYKRMSFDDFAKSATYFQARYISQHPNTRDKISACAALACESKTNWGNSPYREISEP
jgi:LmbE family N-acetylglucosaminyl deacetylase